MMWASGFAITLAESFIRFGGKSSIPVDCFFLISVVYSDRITVETYVKENVD